MLTVAITASGAEEPLVATLRSLALQRDVACEILVVDDGLLESAALTEVAKADPRIRVGRNEGALGEVLSLQRAIGNAAGSVISFVEPGDVLLTGALRTLYEAVTESAGVGMAHAYWVPQGFLGRISRRALRAHRDLLLERLPGTLDHRRALVVLGNMVQALPTFRRDVLQAAGGLVGRSLDEALYTATLRALHHAEVRVIPKVLCCCPRSVAWRGWRLRRRPTHIGALAQCSRITLARQAEKLWTPRQFTWLVGVFLIDSVVHTYPRGWRYRVRRLWRHWRDWASSAPGWRMLLRGRRPYEVFGALVPRWVFPALREEGRGRRGRTDERQRPSRSSPLPLPSVAYVLWRYPALSETFIRREVQALRDADLPLEVVALEPDDPPLPPDPASPAGTVTYYGRTDAATARAFLVTCLRRSPIGVVRLWLWLVRQRYHPRKTWWRDRNTLFDAAHLAIALRRLRVTHVHSPWADQTATLSSIAARLLGVTFSVQARASEIRRTTERQVVADRLGTAKFVITNSGYNEDYLRELLNRGATPPVHTIYNGVELHRFQPPSESTRIGGSWRLLSVARLIEPKGLHHLLRACRAIRDHGTDFTCEIVGGPEDPLYTATWVHLRKLHTDLHLEDCVHFCGAQPFSEVLRALQRADVFVLPCVQARDGARDITPNSLIEAMAMALPVVSTTSGAIPEIVDHEVSGLLVPAGDDAALTAALERLLGDDDLRRRLGQAARRKIEERFDIARNVEQRVTLFRSLRPEQAADPAYQPTERWA